MNVFRFTAKEINKIQLESEISAVVTSFAIKSILVEGDIIVTFTGDILASEETPLASVIVNHLPITGTDIPQPVQLSNVTDEDAVPFVYPTVLPQGWYTCFQGAGDVVATDDNDGVGHGNKFTFRLSSKDESVIKSFTFNEDVYIKDGYIISTNAPFGATIDMEIHHPIGGLILPFARSCPLFSSSWIPLDTSGRAFIPKGLIIRMSVNNSRGGKGSTNMAVYEDSPATFSITGRFELFRKKPAGI